MNLDRAMVTARLQKTKDKPLLTQPEARRRAVTMYAEDVPEVARSKPRVRFRRGAAAEVPGLAKGVNARDAVETVLAMYVMQEAIRLLERR